MPGCFNICLQISGCLHFNQIKHKQGSGRAKWNWMKIRSKHCEQQTGIQSGWVHTPATVCIICCPHCSRVESHHQFNFSDKRKSHVKKTGIHMAVWGEKNVKKERRGGNKKTNNRMLTRVKHSKFFTCINSFKERRQAERGRK